MVPVSRSNRYISRLVPRWRLLRRNGLNICLGTDSLASNTALSLLGEMQHLGKIPLAELLTWAAPNGARALGFSELGEVAAEQTARAGGAVRTGLRLDDAHARIVHRTDSLIGRMQASISVGKRSESDREKERLRKKTITIRDGIPPSLIVTVPVDYSGRYFSTVSRR